MSVSNISQRQYCRWSYQSNICKKSHSMFQLKQETMNIKLWESGYRKMTNVLLQNSKVMILGFFKCNCCALSFALIPLYAHFKFQYLRFVNSLMNLTLQQTQVNIHESCIIAERRNLSYLRRFQVLHHSSQRQVC